MNFGIVVLTVALFPIGVFTKEPTLWSRLQDTFKEKPVISNVASPPVPKEELIASSLPVQKASESAKMVVATSESNDVKQQVVSYVDEYAATENDKTAISLMTRWIMKDYPEIKKVEVLLSYDIPILDYELLNETWRPRVVRSLDSALHRLQLSIKKLPYFSVCLFTDKAYIIPVEMSCSSVRKMLDE